MQYCSLQHPVGGAKSPLESSPILTRDTAAAAAAAAKSLQSCPILCDLIGGSPPGSSIPGILQARVLEWVAIAFSESIMVTCLTLLIMLYIYEEINIYYI